MKNNILKYVAIVFAVQTLFACTPDKYMYVDTNIVHKDSIGKVELLANHKVLVANGSAEIDFRPILHTKGGNLIIDSRVQLEWLEYKTSDGKVISRNFSADASMIGKTINVSFKVKGTDLVSNTVEVEIIAPIAEPKPKTIPIVFHIVQTKQDIESYGGEFPTDRINQILEKINNVFGNLVSTYPTGINTRIKFEMAKYDDFGRVMPEKGINRVRGNDISATTLPTIIGNGLLWSPERYLNIWLISDRLRKIESFGAQISDICLPRYLNDDVDITTIPKGLALTPFPEEGTYAIAESGIVYRLQNLGQFGFGTGNKKNPGDNELIHYIGRYLGLSRTFDFVQTEEESIGDYCDDTIDYIITENPATNIGQYKKAGTYYFLSENIMDDPSGSHRVISQKQCERINWVLENCPERAAWKSSFAFDGK